MNIPLFEQSDARDALKKRCREAKIPISLLESLVAVKIDQSGKARRRSLWQDFDELLNPNSNSETNGD